MRIEGRKGKPLCQTVEVCGAKGSFCPESPYVSDSLQRSRFNPNLSPELTKNSHSDIRCHWIFPLPLLPLNGQERAVPGEPHDLPGGTLLRGPFWPGLLAWRLKSLKHWVGQRPLCRPRVPRGSPQPPSNRWASANSSRGPASELRSWEIFTRAETGWSPCHTLFA